MVDLSQIIALIIKGKPRTLLASIKHRMREICIFEVRFERYRGLGALSQECQLQEEWLSRTFAT